MKKSFQLSAIAIAISLTSAVYADVNVTDPSNVNVYVDDNNGGYGALNVYKGNASDPSTQLLVSVDDNLNGGTTINTNTTINGNLAVNGGTSTILTAAPVSTGADLVIPTVNPAFSNTTQPFSQDRVDTQDQTRSVDAQVIDQNKFQLNTSEQTGQQTWTTSQTASAQYDANGVIIPGSLTGPVLGATVDNGFVASSVNKVQDLTLGRNNTSEDYRLSITKTDNGVTNTTTVNASGITTSRINGNGTNGALVLHGGTNSTTQTLDDNGVSFVTTDAGGNVTGTTTIDANGNLVVKGRDVLADIDAEAATRAAADTQLQANIDAEASTRAAADTQLQANIDAEASMREAGDQAIRDEIATKVTTNALEVNGDSTFNGAVTVNNVKSTTTVDQAGTPATTPEFGADTDGDGRPDTLIQTKEQTDAVTVSSQSQSYNENNLTFSSKTEKGTQTTTDQYTADIIYDQNGVATYGPNVANGQAVTSDLETIAEDSIIVGKETADSETALTIRSKDANGESATVVTSKSVTTGNVSASTITLAGKDLATTIAEGDAATLASANTYTDSKAVETLATANSYTNARVNQLNSRVDDVEKTAYRGIAIALAAQQAIPSIQPGQIAVFGGVGHYEGETAGAVGLVGALNDRTSLSAALGFAGGNEVGGRVGVAYVFGGK